MATTESTEARRLRKQRDGRVVTASADKTIVVLVERRIRHELYGKELKKSKRYHAHDEKNEAKVGDRVRIMETRPISKLKHWRLVEILNRPEA
jgi:small subunit ribosomal protein S17